MKTATAIPNNTPSHGVQPRFSPPSLLIVWTTLAVGNVILLEASLSYLGLGVQPPIPSWGNMLTNAQLYFYRSPPIRYAGNTRIAEVRNNAPVLCS